MNIGKQDIVREIAKAHGQTQEVVRASIDAFLDAVSAEVAKGNRVTLSHFGAFSLKERPERPARNPRTGETMIAKASRSMVFKAAKGREI